MPNWNDYDAPNVGLLFYKALYLENTVKQTLKVNEKGELTFAVPQKGATQFDEYYQALYKKPAKQFRQIQNPLDAEHLSSFSLITTYPGLLIGSGYNHNTKARGDASMGFFFDHTTGQPIIPGSSVKGVCHSVFELDVTAKGKNITGEITLEFFKHLLNDIVEANPSLAEGVDIVKAAISTKEQLEIFKESIFGTDKKPGKDIFLDGILNIQKTGNNTIFYSDFITPHPDPLKNPNPIQFIKVGPGVWFEFRFKLFDITLNLSDTENYTCSAKLKEAIFKQILLDFGIGAKTNVGYGQFHNPDSRQAPTEIAPLSAASIRTEPVDYTGRIKVGIEIQAKVVDQTARKVKIIVSGKEYTVEMTGNCPEMDSVVRVKINQLNKNKEITQVGYLGPAM